MNKKTILVDLDGVLNRYNGKYDEDLIEPLADGAYEFVKEMSKDYKVVIFTTRNLLLTSKWLIENKLDSLIENVTNVNEYETNKKVKRVDTTSYTNEASYGNTLMLGKDDTATYKSVHTHLGNGKSVKETIHREVKGEGIENRF